MFTVCFSQSFTDGMVDGYTVVISPAPPNSPSSRNVTVTTLTLSGLADYTSYTFTVAAYNTAGLGPATYPETASTVEGGQYHTNVVSVMLKKLMLY